jgi:hypothetical protein
MERTVEQRTIRYVLGAGASYMEPDVRTATDQAGFCRSHYKKMFDYGNPLGNALMMQTHMIGLQKELEVQVARFSPPSASGFVFKKQAGTPAILEWLQEKNSSCFLCSKIEYNMDRYYTTFFHLLREADFRKKVENSKGFCMFHFQQILESAPGKLPGGQIDWFYRTLLRLMQDNLARVQGDLDWFIEKFDYRNASAPWKNSKDAVSRSMQKLKGGFPADGPYKQD